MTGNGRGEVDREGRVGLHGPELLEQGLDLADG
jgi:hypothetical protein